MGRSVINLEIEFEDTADTEPLRAGQIAELIQNYIAVQMDAVNVKVSVESAFLSYVSSYEARKAQAAQAVKDALS
jgi:hypothetical protein